MTRQEFRAFLDLLMCSDPWPVKPDHNDTQTVLGLFADAEAKRHGYPDWIEAFHRLPYHDELPFILGHL